MIAIVFAVILMAGLLCLITLVQILYMESLRLRAQERPMLDFFKETLEDKIGIRDERGSLAFSIVKHTALLVLPLLIFAAQTDGKAPLWTVLLETAVLSWAVMLVSTYIAPHLLYRKTSGKWLLPFIPLLHAMSLVLRPLVAALSFFQSLVDLAEPEKKASEIAHPSEHIDAFIAAGTEEGIIEETDRKLIQSVVAFGDKTVREVMTPRPNIVAVEENRSLEDLRDLVINEQYSRIPVYSGTIDQVVGFVHVRDMFELDEEDRKGRTVKELMRPIRLVPETKRVEDLLREMQQDGAHMAIVIDEYGNTGGLVTMEDMVEEILGEIHDEHEPERDVTKEANGAYVVSGSVDVDRLRELVGFRPAEETESTTIGGLVTEWMGHVPHVGETVERDGLRMEVLAGNEFRVDQVRVSSL
ncbi:MAG TPA: hemolysin family protein [Bryobacteraceae bacterium]|nr:hemolysin family protein [Bryobacteraceae bacterium]